MELYSFFLLATTLLAPFVAAVDPVVDLGYSKYKGKDLGNGVTQWLGVRYAAAPLKDLRFRPPQDPVRTTTVQDASDWAKECLATGSNATDESEDCLFINIFAPSNASRKDKLPVFFFIQGGGFNSNSNPRVNGTGLIKTGDMDLIVVTLNYRVGVYGFLNDGKEVTPNIGLLDQRKGLQWVQKHISVFGGDPDHVTMGGDSAGAASVSLHLSAFGGKDEGLFHAVAAESVSFATVLTVKESFYQYENLAIRLSCTKDVLACMRSKTVKEIQDVNTNIAYPGGPAPPLYMWTPVVDGDLIPDVTYNLFEEGKFIKVPAIMGDDTNGGTSFAPPNTATLAQSDEFLKTQFPFLTLGMLDKINALYPNQNDTCPNTGCYWRQVSDAYGQMRYMCPGIYISNALTQYGVPDSWNYRYNVEDPEQMAQGLGVPHTVEVHAIFGAGLGGDNPPASYVDGEKNAPVIPVIQGYWTSFIRSYDPNKYRHKGSVKWETWSEKRKQRIVFETAGKTKMEKIGRDLERKFNMSPLTCQQQLRGVEGLSLPDDYGQAHYNMDVELLLGGGFPAIAVDKSIIEDRLSHTLYICDRCFSTFLIHSGSDFWDRVCQTLADEEIHVPSQHNLLSLVRDILQARFFYLRDNGLFDPTTILSCNINILLYQLVLFVDNSHLEIDVDAGFKPLLVEYLAKSRSVKRELEGSAA
ncbi:cholinesterase precursor [Fusarium albosuccineum]|uniref:Cholinesterase n=1 Tax=Fusarium albosuccineum TaxID=1237068 RepID=A0A8H4LFN5_9HYPO|nr:cholinesterase precursor [Fusarium albosuccineum]